MHSFQQVENIEDEESLELVIAGWGFTEVRQAMSDVLRHASVKYKPQDECIEFYNNMNKVYPQIKTNIRDTQMCAGGDGKVDTWV